MNAAASAAVLPDDLDVILRLARHARDAERSPQWKIAQDDAIEAHGAACDALWAELYRQLEAREAAGNPVPKPHIPPDPRKQIKQEILARLKADLPEMVSSIIDEF
jgi:hypothetical protein